MNEQCVCGVQIIRHVAPCPSCGSIERVQEPRRFTAEEITAEMRRFRNSIGSRGSIGWARMNAAISHMLEWMHKEGKR